MGQKKSSPGWMGGFGGWMDWWVEAKASLRIAYSNKKENDKTINNRLDNS